MPTKIIDVSNSSERPPHRGGGGPLENSIVTMLKKYCSNHSCEFVDNIDEADILFTNDVYPSWTDKYDIRRVKRMDGVYWKKEYVERNEPLNAAAKKSDMVIFISKYSHQSYHDLYGELGAQHNVVLNWCDEEYFHPSDLKRHSTVLSAAASSWDRQQKRFNDIKLLAENFPLVDFVLIGKQPSQTWPKNIYLAGAINDPREYVGLLRQCKGFVNLSHRDAAPKVVAEAQASGLPVFFADSGGVPELVHTGLRVEDPSSVFFMPETPRLNKEQLIDRFNKYLSVLDTLYETARTYARETHLKKTRQLMTAYFSLIKGE